MLDRLRRIETRVTKFLETQGFDTKVKRPSFDDGMLEIPSLQCAIKEILSAVPDDYVGTVTVTHKGDEVLVFDVD